MPEIERSSELQRTAYAPPADDLLLPGLVHIGWSLFADARPDALHAHRHEGAYELCYIERGRVGWWVGDEHYDLEPGDCYLTRPDEWHGGEHGVMDRCELYWLSFTLAEGSADYGIPAAELAAIETPLRTSATRVCRGSPRMPGHWRGMLEAIGSGMPHARTVCRGHLALLLSEAAAAYATATAGPAPIRARSPRIAEAVDWMRAHQAQPVSVDEIAAAVELRPSRFRELFREETGFTPQEYLTQLRLDEAKRLLDETSRSVTDIALATGFNSSQYFATTFKRLTGFSPSAYRKR